MDSIVCTALALATNVKKNKKQHEIMCRESIVFNQRTKFYEHICFW
jgi:hypothetical protein